MSKLRLVKLAVATAATIGAMAGLGVLSAGTALATPTPGQAAAAYAASVSPDYAIAVPVIRVNGYRAPLYDPDNNLVLKLEAGTDVEVTCYYKGSPPAPYVSDGYMDHVDGVAVAGYEDFSGHVPDDYVNLGGDTPPEYGVPPCKKDG
jgi:hypothetical protein